MKENILPVIVLKNIILFPNSEIRLELDKSLDKEILSLAEAYYDKHILITNQVDILEKDTSLSDLSNVGVVGYIELKLDLPNNKTRVVIRGIKRVKVCNYKQEEDNLVVATYNDLVHEKLEKLEEEAYSRSLKRQLEYYINNNPSMSNSILSTINRITTLDKLTDVICLSIPGSYDRKLEYINETSPTIRTTMLIEDINQELKIISFEKQIEEKVSKNLDKTQKEYILQEKLKVIKDELGITLDKDEEITILKEKIDSLKCPLNIKTKLERELKRYEMTPSTSPDLAIIRNYLDFMLDLPYEIETKDNKNLLKAKALLDETHYGLEDVKTRIIEYLALSKTSSLKSSPIICLVGPPGVGKTSFARSIALATNKNYVKISVGGVSDEAEIIGHRKTYIGASSGRIMSGIKKAKSKNPVFVIDEIDKLCKDIKGDPASALLEVLDKEQNSTFVDNYVSESFDLSKVMFICTANYISDIPLELKDRLEIIELNSYTEYEKLNIAKKHIIPKSIKEVGLILDKVKFTDKAITKIIRCYTKEAGVRELERQINTILRKIVTEEVINNTKKDYLITEKVLSSYLKEENYLLNETSYLNRIGVVNGMAYTPLGGDLLPIEVSLYKGKGNIITTGYLGHVFKESVETSLGYIKSNCNYLAIAYSSLIENDIHLHVPENAIKKEGPSAGITILTALISSLKNKEIPKNIAMTGEITLKGNILPVGGIKEKIIGVKKYGVDKIFLPKQNKKDLEAIDEKIKKGITFVLVDNYKEVIKELDL